MSRATPRPPHRSGATGVSSDAIEAQAADWIARRNGGFTPAAQAEFDAWLTRDPRHAQAFATMERTWTHLNEPRHAGESDARWTEIQNLRRLRSRRRRLTWSALGMAAAIALMATSSFRPPTAPAPTPDSATTRPIIRTLDDGSKVAVRPGAAIEVNFSPDFRRVRLVRGEALFSVAKDTTRPFIVQVGVIEVRAVGTEFSVGQGANAITVVVTEGRIAVARGDTVPTTSANESAAPIFAVAGERVVVSEPAASNPPPAVVTPLTARQLASALAWRGQRLEFSDTPLAEALELVNRGQSVKLVLAEAALGQRTLTGVLWADDSEGLVRLLENGFNLTAEREGNVVRLRARR